MSEYKDVWVFSENFDLMLELLAAGNLFTAKNETKLVAVLLGSKVRSKADKAIRHGADKVFIFDDLRLRDFQIETYLNTLTTLVKDSKPEILLIGSTKNGKELASRLAARLETGCTSDCIQLSTDEEGHLVTKRIAYSGNAIATATYTKKPQIATIMPRTFEKLKPKKRNGDLVSVETDVEEPKVNVVGAKKMEVADVKIEEAQTVVCGGRGIEKREDLKLLNELAQLLGGQVSNTRPLAEDRKWFTGWIGLSGKKVRPKLYLGVGVSGMIQHVAGMRDSQIVVAINKNPEAAIFKVADYIVVGDLYEVVPALIEELKSKLG